MKLIVLFYKTPEGITLNEISSVLFGSKEVYFWLEKLVKLKIFSTNNEDKFILND